MKYFRIAVAGTLAAACLALEGSSATVAAEEKSRTLRATGGTRLSTKTAADARPSGRPITRESPGRTGPARSSLRTAPGHRKPNWNAGVSTRNSWNEPRERTGGLCRRRTTPGMEPIASEDGATSARGAGNRSSRGETG